MKKHISRTSVNLSDSQWFVSKNDDTVMVDTHCYNLLQCKRKIEYESKLWSLSNKNITLLLVSL